MLRRADFLATFLPLVLRFAALRAGFFLTFLTAFFFAAFFFAGFLTAAGALKLLYGNLRTAGIGTGSGAPMLPFADMNNLMGFPAVHAFEKRHGLADSHQK